MPHTQAKKIWVPETEYFHKVIPHPQNGKSNEGEKNDADFTHDWWIIGVKRFVKNGIKEHEKSKNESGSYDNKYPPSDRSTGFMTVEFVKNGGGLVEEVFGLLILEI